MLLAFGINIEKSPSKLCIFLGVFFHIIWILIFINKVACFDKTDVTYHVFTLIKYLCALITWWILYKKRKEISQLISSVRRIEICLKKGCNLKLKKQILRASLFSVFVVFGPGIICCIKLAIEDEYPMFFCPHHQKVMTEKNKARILHFWLLSGFNYAGRSLSYIVTIFYSFYCMELKRLANYLETKARHILHTSTYETNDIDKESLHFCDDLKKVYLQLLKLLTQFDDTFSSIIFFQFVNSFLEILRIETVVFMYIKGRWQLSIIVHSMYYFFVGALSILAIILSADSAQNACHSARILLHDYKSSFSPGRFLKSFYAQIQYLQEARFARLTAWGMFQIKKDLFLSITALFLSYGILIAQITPRINSLNTPLTSS